MTRTFGEQMYIMYLQELENQIKNSKALASVKKSTKKKKEANSLDNTDNEEISNTWNEEEPQGITLKSFSFNK